MRGPLRVLWQRWKLIAERIAHFQAYLIFGLLYFLVVTPFAIGMKLFSDPLHLRQANGGSRWRTLQRQTLRLEDARRQF